MRRSSGSGCSADYFTFGNSASLRGSCTDRSYVTPTLSEFSYGFALTNELIGLAGEPLRIAPIFPSLVEEGRAGGGYDVHLDLPGFPLFLQFKRSDCMVRSNTRELAKGLKLHVPYYRFPITARSRSTQHDMLCDLDDDTSNQVFYAAPRFHEVGELDTAYLSQAVAERSFYIRPREIGTFPDDGGHYVVFDETQHYVCSEARKVEGVKGRELLEKLQARLASDTRPLRSGLIVRSLEVAEGIVSRRDLQRLQPDVSVIGRTEEEVQLQRLADLALRFFGAQLFVVQPRSVDETPES